MISVFLLEPLLCIGCVSWNSPGLKWWTSFTCSQFFLASLGKEKKQQMLESCKQFTLFPIIMVELKIYSKLEEANFGDIPFSTSSVKPWHERKRTTRTVDKAPGQQTHSVSCRQRVWRRKNGFSVKRKNQVARELKRSQIHFEVQVSHWKNVHHLVFRNLNGKNTLDGSNALGNRKTNIHPSHVQII